MDLISVPTRLGQVVSVLLALLFATAMAAGVAHASPALSSPEDVDSESARDLAGADAASQHLEVAFGETETETDTGGDGGDGGGGAFGFGALVVGGMTVAVLRTLVMRRRKADQARRRD